MAKARNTLEALNYKVEKVSLLSAAGALDGCAVLVVAGAEGAALLEAEVRAVGEYLTANGNASFMLDPFVESGLEPVLARPRRGGGRQHRD